MEVDEEVVLGCHVGHAIIKVNHFLVVTIHEIDFEAFDSHLGVMLADPLHVVVDGGIAGPENQTHVTFLAVGHQLGQVDLGYHLEQVGFLVNSPAFVQDDIFDAVSAGKVDVVFIGLCVDTCLEVYTIDVPSVPPIPCHLAGFDPADVIDTAWRGQKVHHVVVSQVLVVFRDDDTAPGEGPLAVDFGDVVLPFFHHILQVVVSSLNLAFWIAGVDGAEATFALGVTEQQTGEVFQVGFGDDGLGAVGIVNQSRQEHQPFRVHLAHRCGGIGVLKRGEELLLDEVTFAFAGIHIGDHHRVVLVEVEVGGLRGNGNLIWEVGHETVGDTFVVGAEDHPVVVFESQYQLVV